MEIEHYGSFAFVYVSGHICVISVLIVLNTHLAQISCLCLEDYTFKLDPFKSEDILRGLYSEVLSITQILSCLRYYAFHTKLQVSVKSVVNKASIVLMMGILQYKHKL